MSNPISGETLPFARPDPEAVARTVNAAWTVTRRRLESEARARRPDPLDLAARLDRLERDLEAVVGLLAEREAA